MKKLINLILLITLAMSCGIDNNVAEFTANDAPPSSATLISEGNFTTGTKPTSGAAKLFFNSTTRVYSLFLEGFSTGNGPDVHVYLSTNSSTVAGTNDLGDIVSTNGNQRYDFPESIYEPNQMTVVIWCNAFPQTFGHATLN